MNPFKTDSEPGSLKAIKSTETIHGGMAKQEGRTGQGDEGVGGESSVFAITILG